MVKLRTHHIVNLALMCTFVGQIFNFDLITIGLAYAVTAITDWSIDTFGHKRSPDGYITRTLLTHSILTAPIWGFSIGLGFFLVLKNWLAFLPISTITLILAGVVGSLVHLLLDSVTANGIYFPFKRASLSHRHSDDLALNSVLGLASMLQIFIMLPIMLLLDPASWFSRIAGSFFPSATLPQIIQIVPTIYPFFMPSALAATVIACHLSNRGKPTVAWQDSHPQTTAPQTSSVQAPDLPLDPAPPWLQHSETRPNMRRQLQECSQCGAPITIRGSFCQFCGAPAKTVNNQ